MAYISKLQLQKILEKKRLSQVSAPKLTIAETEKLIADRKMIADVFSEFEQFKTMIEAETNQPLSCQDINNYFDSLAFENKNKEGQRIEAAKAQKNNDADFMLLKDAFEPKEKPKDQDFMMLKNAFELEEETIKKDADFMMLEAAFSEDNN